MQSDIRNRTEASSNCGPTIKTAHARVSSYRISQVRRKRSPPPHRIDHANADIKFGASRAMARRASAGGIPRQLVRRAIGWSAEGKPRRMGTQVLGPGRYVLVKSATIVRKQSPRRLLEPGQISRHRGHEVIGRLLRRAHLRRRTRAALGFIHQSSQHHRRATGLRGQPLPLTRQQGDFAPTTPSLGRPGPRDSPVGKSDAAGADLRRAFACSAPSAETFESLATTSAFVPRRSKSMTRPVVSSKTRMGAAPPRSEAFLTASATSINGPAANNRLPSKAVEGFERRSVIG